MGLRVRMKADFDISGLSEPISPRTTVRLTLTGPDGRKKSFEAVARLDSAVEVNYYRHGGILPAVLRGFLKGN